MLQIDLPTSEELPCSDDTPVDNEDQNLLPNVLLFLLNSIWAQRMDWYFGVDMAVYHTIGLNPRVPVVPLAWFDQNGDRYLSEAETERQRKEQLAARLRELGEDPDLL
jgi:Uma2 family endonuclease